MELTPGVHCKGETGNGCCSAVQFWEDVSSLREERRGRLQQAEAILYSACHELSVERIRALTTPQTKQRSTAPAPKKIRSSSWLGSVRMPPSTCPSQARLWCVLAPRCGCLRRGPSPEVSKMTRPSSSMKLACMQSVIVAFLQDGLGFFAGKMKYFCYIPRYPYYYPSLLSPVILLMAGRPFTV